MQVFKVTIACANDAVAHDNPDAPSEIARMLRQVADKLEARDFSPTESIPIFDVNGNRVGSAGVECGS